MSQKLYLQKSVAELERLFEESLTDLTLSSGLNQPTT
ncbi:hypothetical protein J2Z50_000148 [Ensifer mexicanus]|nr:hypothetical protein [Sinorhizobium mexicanum]